MKTLLKDVTGLFRIVEHRSSVRGGWVLVTLLSCALFVLGCWAMVTDFFHLQQDVEAPLFSHLLVFCVTLLLPAIALALALPRSVQRPGSYLHGVRLTAGTIERGTLSLPADDTGAAGQRGRTSPAFGNSGQWLTDRVANNRDFELLLVVRLHPSASNLVSIARLTVTIDGRPFDQFQSLADNENCWQKLAIVTDGVILPVDGETAMESSEFLRALAAVARVLAVSAQVPPPRCTLRLLSSQASRNSPLATGVLGSFAAGEGGPSSRKRLEDFFNPKFCEPLKKLLRENGWHCYLDDERQ